MTLRADYDSNIHACMRCDFRGRPQGGACECTYSGRDISEHAAAGKCPLRVFDTPPSDRIPRRAPMEARYLALLQESIKLLPEYPQGRFAGRGIVVAGGGKYFDSAYVTIRIVRHLGYEGEIELWHFADEIFPWMVEALSPLNVGLVNADEALRKYPAFIGGKYRGYQLKPYAIINSGFAEVLYLDADAYPIRWDFLDYFDHPRFQEHGAVYHPDSSDQDLKPNQWQLVGLEHASEPAFESGIIFADKARVWRELNLALWFCEHGDFYFRHILGDKDTFHLSHRLLGSGYAMPPSRWTWPDGSLPGADKPHQAAMIQHDLNGVASFAHRTVSKFSLTDSVGLDYFDTTRQINAKRDEKIPYEAFGWTALEELRKIRSGHLVCHRLESNGDLLTLLPAWRYLARNHKLTVVTCDKYAPLLDGLDWLTVVPFDGSPRDVAGAKKLVECAGELRDIVPTEAKESWPLEAWSRTGLGDDLFRTLPLEIENRDAVAEAEIISRYVHPHKPLLLVNTLGRSSPYTHGDNLRAMLAEYSQWLNVVDLGLINAPRIVDLIGLYECAACLISTDTATLHLSYATGTPTIALIRDPKPDGDRRWFLCSEPRPHWIERLTYTRSATPEGLDIIRAAINRVFHIPQESKE